MQRGFLRGRSILRNVLEVDWQAMKVSLKASQGAIVLFDFEAAFPSISQDYLFSSLEAVGLPAPLLQVIRSLYKENRCLIKHAGSLFLGFASESGVRQGCPLSPLLFVLAVDILLRRLSRFLNTI